MHAGHRLGRARSDALARAEAGGIRGVAPDKGVTTATTSSIAVTVATIVTVNAAIATAVAVTVTVGAALMLEVAGGRVERRPPLPPERVSGTHTKGDWHWH
jgi:hypothetical protein